MNKTTNSSTHQTNMHKRTHTHIHKKIHTNSKHIHLPTQTNIHTYPAKQLYTHKHLKAHLPGPSVMDIENENSHTDGNSAQGHG